MSENLHIDFNSSGLEFKGIGAVTSNGMSRLLYDYPGDIRKDILDLLFLTASDLRYDNGRMGHHYRAFYCHSFPSLYQTSLSVIHSELSAPASILSV